MKTFKTFFFLLFLTICVGNLEILASLDKNDGNIVAIRDYDFPLYSQAVENTDVERYSSKEEYESASRDKNFKFQKITYLSDNLKVIAYLYKPQKTEGKKYPAIIFNRGSYIRGDIAPELISMFHRLAENGFVILAPLYRQSDGGEGRDRLGGEDMNDLMNTLPVAKNLKFIDTNNLFMYGESRGGMMTYQAIKKGFPLNATAVYGAFSDMENMVNSRPDIYTTQLGKMIFGNDYESQKEEIFRTRSAINWVEKFNVPTLIMHGGDDASVNPTQSLKLAQKLLKSKKVYELVVYAEDNHILSANKFNRDEKTARWFKRFLKK